MRSGYMGDYLRASFAFLFAVVALYGWIKIGFAHTLPIAAAASLAVFFGFLYLQSAQRRRHGVRSEKSAVASLRRELGKMGHLVTGKMTPYGDVDALLVISGRTFSVEIKSWRKFDRKSVRDQAALLQALRIGRYVNATPVLYFPLSRIQPHNVDGVLVIGGSARTVVAKLLALC